MLNFLRICFHNLVKITEGECIQICKLQGIPKGYCKTTEETFLQCECCKILKTIYSIKANF